MKNSKKEEFAFLKYTNNIAKKLKIVFILITIINLFIISTFIIDVVIPHDTSQYKIGFVLIAFMTLFNILAYYIQTPSAWISTLINKSNFKIDLNNKIVNIYNYPVIVWYEDLGKHTLTKQTVDLPINKIDSIRKYNKYFVITSDFSEFLLPINEDTNNIVSEYDNLLRNEIGKNIEITEWDNPNNDLIINAQIIDTQDHFDGLFYRRLFIVKTENDLTINNKNYGKIFILLNRLSGNNFTENRNIYLGILHDKYEPSKPINMFNTEPIFIGNLNYKPIAK